MEQKKIVHNLARFAQINFQKCVKTPLTNKFHTNKFHEFRIVFYQFAAIQVLQLSKHEKLTDILQVK